MILKSPWGHFPKGHAVRHVFVLYNRGPHLGDDIQIPVGALPEQTCREAYFCFYGRGPHSGDNIHIPVGALPKQTCREACFCLSKWRPLDAVSILSSFLFSCFLLVQMIRMVRILARIAPGNMHFARRQVEKAFQQQVRQGIDVG
jgi:hypothetical protein